MKKQRTIFTNLFIFGIADALIFLTIRFARKHFRNSWVHKLPVTSRIYKRLYLLTAREHEKEVKFMGLHLLVPTHDTTIVPSILDNSYETFELQVFSKLTKGKPVVFDIGANLGLYSLIAARINKGESQVYAFEPVEENQRYIAENIKRNGLKNINVIPSAIGQKSGRMKIYLADNSIGTHSAGRVTGNSIDVSTTTIDRFSKKIGAMPDVIKIDIEGYEAYAVAGGLTTIKNSMPTLFIEFDTKLIKNCGSDPRKLASDLFQIYPHKYLLDEKKQLLKSLNDVESLRETSNINLVFSVDTVKL